MFKKFLDRFKKRGAFKPLTILVLEDWYKDELKQQNHNPFGKEKYFIYFGEITNMPGHGVFLGHLYGKIFSGYHIENFRVPTDDEF